MLLAVASDQVADARVVLQGHWDQELEVSEREHANTVADFDADVATCPACQTVFKTDVTRCPECGLNFGE